MAKQVKIKDIAKMAGVSAGTVDRILHNRGNVSKTSREAVERVLKEVDYKYNIHASAVSLRKEYKIIVSIPISGIGEYWGSIQNGIDHAISEYSDISINCIYSFYNQFDIYSCRTAFDGIVDTAPDAVIIGPTFIEETRGLCSRLDEKGIPYVFVDAVIDGTNPIATFTTDQYACGLLLARLLHAVASEDAEFALFRNRRVGNQSASNSVARKQGFLDYFARFGLQDRIHETYFSVMSPDENDRNVLDFMNAHPKIEEIAALNSRGYIVADILSREWNRPVKMVTFDVTTNNVRCLRDGSINALLCQRPEMQGFLAVRAAISRLLYNMDNPAAQKHVLMPIDILMKENIDYYQTFLDL